MTTRRASLIGVAALALVAGSAPAQAPPVKRGRPAGEITLTGRIAKVVKHSVNGQPEIHLIIEVRGRNIEIHIAPAYYLAWHQFQLRPGDPVEIAARKAATDPHFDARHIRCGVRSLELRDRDYRPLWKKGQK